MDLDPISFSYKSKTMPGLKLFSFGRILNKSMSFIIKVWSQIIWVQNLFVAKKSVKQKNLIYQKTKEQERKLTHTKTSEPVHTESASSFIFESIPKPTPITGEPESKLLEHSISQNAKIKKNENGKLDLELPKVD